MRSCAAFALVLAACHGSGGSGPALCVLDPAAGRISLFDGDLKSTAATRSITGTVTQQTLSPVSMALAGDDLVLVDSVSKRIVVYGRGALFLQPAPQPVADFRVPVSSSPPWVGLDPGPVAYDAATDTIVVQQPVLLPQTRVEARLTELTRSGSMVRSGRIACGFRVCDELFGFALDDERDRILVPDPGGLISIPRALMEPTSTLLVNDPAKMRSPLATGTNLLLAYKTGDRTLEIRNLASVSLLHQITAVPVSPGVLPPLAIDETHGEAFLSDGSRVYVYALDADGTVPPLRILEAPAAIAAIAYDAARERLIVAGADGTIAAFARDAHGAAAPLATLTATRSDSHIRSAVDLAAEPGKVWILDDNGAAVSFSHATGSEAATEIRDLSSLGLLQTLALTPDDLLVSNWIVPRSGEAQCTLPIGIQDLKRAVAVGRQALLLTSGDDLITVESDSAPCPYQSRIRVLSGLSSPIDVAADAVHREMFVLHSDSISVFALEASGAPAPLRAVPLAAEHGAGMRILYDASRDRIDVLTGKAIESWPRVAAASAPPTVLPFTDASLDAPVAFALCQ